jgi:hypothetical protein
MATTVMDSFDFVNVKEELVLGLNTKSHTLGSVGAEDIEVQYWTILEVNGEYVKESNGEEVKGLLRRQDFLLKRPKNKS